MLARHATETAATLAEGIEEAALAWQDGATADDIDVVVLRVPGGATDLSTGRSSRRPSLLLGAHLSGVTLVGSWPAG